MRIILIALIVLAQTPLVFAENFRMVYKESDKQLLGVVHSSGGQWAKEAGY